MGPLHGYGIARRIEQISEDALRLNQGTIYAALVRLLQKGWIRAAWGTSENNRKARFYSITKSELFDLNCIHRERLDRSVQYILRDLQGVLVPEHLRAEASPAASTRAQNRSSCDIL
jgi:PadR family transcriptional regulator, regulatory protein PadR